MTIHAKRPPAGGADGPLELSSLGGVDLQANIPNQVLSQKDNRASEITCVSMRAAELRDCLIRQIAGAAVIAAQAQTALVDGDDDIALSRLRCLWIALQSGVVPLAAELAALQRARAAQ
jgi:hypothetical protein